MKLFDRYDLKVDQKVFDNIKQITLIIGVWYQAQNDFIDCYVDPVTKPGHDIENGKLSWFAAMAMERGSEEQKNVMRKNYGKYGKIESNEKSKNPILYLHFKFYYFQFKIKIVWPK